MTAHRDGGLTGAESEGRRAERRGLLARPRCGGTAPTELQTDPSQYPHRRQRRRARVPCSSRLSGSLEIVSQLVSRLFYLATKLLGSLRAAVRFRIIDEDRPSSIQNMGNHRCGERDKNEPLGRAQATSLIPPQDRDQGGDSSTSSGVCFVLPTEGRDPTEGRARSAERTASD